MHSSVIFSLISVLIVCVSISNSVKTFRADTSFLEPSNWKSGQVPCGANTAIFPLNASVAVDMPMELTLKGIILPMNGALIFPFNMEWQWGNFPATSKCPEKDNEYIGHKPVDWFDPEAWDIDPIEGESNMDEVNRVTPHAERIPCQGELSVFSNSFNLLIDGVNGTVAAVQISEDQMDQKDFDSFVNSTVGALQVHYSNGGKLNIKGQLCTDITGCECGNTSPILLERVCAVQSQRCSNELSKCTNPIMPTGHCCDFCGADLVLEISPDNFRFKLFDRGVRQFLLDKGGDVISHVGKLDSSHIQISLMDRGGASGDKSVAISEELKEYLLSASTGNLGVVDISIQTSGGKATPFAYTGTSTKPALLAIFGILVLVGLLGALAWIWKRNNGNCTATCPKFPTITFPQWSRLTQPDHSFVFAKFENEGGITLEIAKEAESDTSDTANVTSFENPMYGAGGGAMEEEHTTVLLAMD